MKRKFNPNPKHSQPSFRSSSIKDVIGDRTFDARFNTHEAEGMKRVKRVKFRDLETDDLQNSKPNASSIQYEVAEAHRSSCPDVAAKTAEYAFFKRMKETTCNVHPMHDEDNQLKSIKPSNHFKGEIPNVQKDSSKYARSSLPVEKERCHADNYFVSPSGDKSKNSLPPSKGSKSNTSVGNKGLFSTKREKLRQWVADALLPEVNELSSKGLDLVSILLSRLLPEGEEDNCRRNPVLCQAEIDPKHERPCFSESESAMLIKGHQAPKRNLIQSDHRSYLGDGFSGFSTRLWDMDLLEWDSMGSEASLVSQAAKANIQYKYSSADGWRIPSLYREGSKSSHEFLQRYEFGGPEELDDLLVQNEPKLIVPCRLLPGWDDESENDDLLVHDEPKFIEQPRRLLLGWDDESEKDNKELYALDSNTEMNIFSASTTSRDDEYHLSLPNRLVSSRTYCSSPLLPRYHLDSFVTSQSGRHLGEENCLGPLTLPCTPKRLKLVEDSLSDNIVEGCSIRLPPEDYTWRLNEDLNEKEPHGLDSFPFSIPLPANDPLGFLRNRRLRSFLIKEDDEQDFLYSPDHFSEGREKCYYPSSSYSEPSHGKHFCHLGFPLLLHNSSSDDTAKKQWSDNYRDGCMYT